ncbi:MAG: hypothetical protein ABI597_03560 [Gammaproteobacteria bacterium]
MTISQSDPQSSPNRHGGLFAKKLPSTLKAIIDKAKKDLSQYKDELEAKNIFELTAQCSYKKVVSSE